MTGTLRKPKSARNVLWTIALGLDLLLLVLFAVGYVARYVHPRHFWWGELVATGLPYLALAVGVATVVVLFTRRPVLIGVHALALVLIVMRFGPLWWSRAPQPVQGDELSVMTLNLPSSYSQVNGDSLSPLVDEQDVDLLALQEARLFWLRRHQAWALDRSFMPLVRTKNFRLALPEPAAPRTQTLMPVLARIPMGDYEIVPLYDRDDEKVLQELVRVRFHWQGRPAVLYNLHLRSFTTKPWEGRMRWTSWAWWRYHVGRLREAYLARAEEAEIIRGMIQQETDPVIVVGDFNSTPHNWSYAHLAEGLVDAFTQAGQGRGTTYRADRPLVRIDYVLVSPEWEVVEAHVPEVTMSDHRPLVARLRWRADE